MFSNYHCLDCKRDGSDEQNCPKSPIVCNYPSRLCDNGRYRKIHKYCNHYIKRIKLIRHN